MERFPFFLNKEIILSHFFIFPSILCKYKLTSIIQTFEFWPDRLIDLGIPTCDDCYRRSFGCVRRFQGKYYVTDKAMAYG